MFPSNPELKIEEASEKAGNAVAELASSNANAHIVVVQQSSLPINPFSKKINPTSFLSEAEKSYNKFLFSMGLTDDLVINSIWVGLATAWGCWIKGNPDKGADEQGTQQPDKFLTDLFKNDKFSYEFTAVLIPFALILGFAVHGAQKKKADRQYSYFFLLKSLYKLSKVAHARIQRLIEEEKDNKLWPFLKKLSENNEIKEAFYVFEPDLAWYDKLANIFKPSHHLARYGMDKKQAEAILTGKLEEYFKLIKCPVPINTNAEKENSPIPTSTLVEIEEPNSKTLNKALFYLERKVLKISASRFGKITSKLWNVLSSTTFLWWIAYFGTLYLPFTIVRLIGQSILALIPIVPFIGGVATYIGVGIYSYFKKNKESKDESKFSIIKNKKLHILQAFGEAAVPLQLHYWLDKISNQEEKKSKEEIQAYQKRYENFFNSQAPSYISTLEFKKNQYILGKARRVNIARFEGFLAGVFGWFNISGSLIAIITTILGVIGIVTVMPIVVIAPLAAVAVGIGIFLSLKRGALAKEENESIENRMDELEVSKKWDKVEKLKQALEIRKKFIHLNSLSYTAIPKTFNDDLRGQRNLSINHNKGWRRLQKIFQHRWTDFRNFVGAAFSFGAGLIRRFIIPFILIPLLGQKLFFAVLGFSLLPIILIPMCLFGFFKLYSERKKARDREFLELIGGGMSTSKEDVLKKLDHLEESYLKEWKELDKITKIDIPLPTDSFNQLDSDSDSGFSEENSFAPLSNSENESIESNSYDEDNHFLASRRGSISSVDKISMDPHSNIAANNYPIAPLTPLPRVSPFFIPSPLEKGKSMRDNSESNSIHNIL